MSHRRGRSPARLSSGVRSAKTMTRNVAKNEETFWQRFESFTAPSSIFDAQGDDHADIDFRLVEKIDGYLVPKIGNWEQSSKWFHNIDFYGDGVRALELSVECFSPAYIPAFQAMLVGEHVDFTVLCKVMTELSDSGERIGSVAVRSEQILVSHPLAQHFAGQI